MAKYYAYVPRKDGTEPMGTGNRSLFSLKTDAGAIRRARRSLGDTVRVERYTNFYDDDTFTRIWGNDNGSTEL